MRRKKKMEESISRTSDLRNVIAEIQKVDQETADLSSVVAEAQKIEKKNYSERRDVYVTCRVLFYSVLDKIFLLLLFLGFCIMTYFNFRGDIFSGTYGYWRRVLLEIGIILLFAILSFIVNWFYNCIVKTMLCVCRGMIYKESYLPFWHKVTSIPLRHVSSISIVNFLWIFRSVIIFQYHHFPMIFFTWNNQKFKDKVDELLGFEQNISNSYESKSLFQRKHIPYLQWMFIILIILLIILGVFHLFGYLFSTERSISGTYSNGNQYITLKTNMSCDIKVNRIHDLMRCSWSYDEENSTIEIQYEYSKDNYFGNAYTKKDSMVVGYQEKALTYNGVEYSKK